jgi:uncharacterized protein YdhG (YjbR/CyaY superfamily)
MAKLKTQPTRASVTEFLASIEDRQQRAESRKVAAMLRRATGKRAKMWGSSIVGYGSYHYHYASGREGDFMITGFSPRKQALTVYIMPGFSSFEKLMVKLGKYKTGKSCLYIKRLSDVDEKLLEKLITESVRVMRSRYQTK